MKVHSKIRTGIRALKRAMLGLPFVFFFGVWFVSGYVVITDDGRNPARERLEVNLARLLYRDTIECLIRNPSEFPAECVQRKRGDRASALIEMFYASESVEKKQKLSENAKRILEKWEPHLASEIRREIMGSPGDRATRMNGGDRLALECESI